MVDGGKGAELEAARGVTELWDVGVSSSRASRL